VRNATTIPTNITIYTPAILIRPILFPDSAEIKAKERFINHSLPPQLTLKFRFVEHGSIAEQSTFSVSGFGLGNLPNKVGRNDIMQSLNICTIAMVLTNLSRECRQTFRPFGSIVLSELKDKIKFFVFAATTTTPFPQTTHTKNTTKHNCSRSHQTTERQFVDIGYL